MDGLSLIIALRISTVVNVIAILVSLIQIAITILS